MSVDYRVGDTRDVIATIPDGSISLVACSPPFVALRSYLPADHPDKHREIGSEPDPATFIDTLLALTAEWGRVLAPWGSIAIELGDTYSGSSMTGGDDNGSERYPGGRSSVQEIHAPKRGAGWPQVKSLALVPQAYALSLAYGRNVLNGNPSPAGQWRVRNQIVWHRPNPAVGALGDKVRPSTSYITVATRSAKRWFDLTAVRTPYGGDGTPPERKQNVALSHSPTKGNAWDGEKMMKSNPTGAPPLDCWFDEHDHHDTWTITTQPSKLAHYAMWPAKLAERLILMMCPAEVCIACGEPRRRVEGRSERYAAIRAAVGNFNQRIDAQGSFGGSRSEQLGKLTCAENVTLGWTDCGCGAPWTPGTVLDPFAGTFTTGLVAEYHGRDAIGIDIDPRNAELVPLRREEVRRNLNPTHVRQTAGQLDMFSEGAA